jgi:hypothetical protein
MSILKWVVVPKGSPMISCCAGMGIYCSSLRRGIRVFFPALLNMLNCATVHVVSFLDPRPQGPAIPLKPTSFFPLMVFADVHCHVLPLPSVLHSAIVVECLFHSLGI